MLNVNNNFSGTRVFTIILLLEKREHSLRTSWLEALDVILQMVHSPNCSTCGIEGVSREMRIMIPSCRTV